MRRPSFRQLTRCTTAQRKRPAAHAVDHAGTSSPAATCGRRGARRTRSTARTCSPSSSGLPRAAPTRLSSSTENRRSRETPRRGGVRWRSRGSSSTRRTTTRTTCTRSARYSRAVGCGSGCASRSSSSRAWASPPSVSASCSASTPPRRRESAAGRGSSRPKPGSASSSGKGWRRSR